MVDRTGNPMYAPPYGAAFAVVEPPSITTGPEGDPVMVVVVEPMTTPLPPQILGHLYMAR
jgi:hypothetical protein